MYMKYKSSRAAPSSWQETGNVWLIFDYCSFNKANRKLISQEFRRWPLTIQVSADYNYSLWRYSAALALMFGYKGPQCPYMSHHLTICVPSFHGPIVVPPGLLP